MQERDFRLWWIAALVMDLGFQMIEVAIGWQVYSLHRKAIDLGLIGLAEFVPMLLFAIPAGQLADRLPRRQVFAASLALGALVAAGLALVTGAGVTATAPFFALAFGIGTVNTLGSPAAQAMAPNLVSPAQLPSAMTLRSAAVQVGTIAGPALGGLLYGFSPSLVYGLAGAASLVAVGLVWAMHPRPAASAAVDPAALEEPATLADAFAGLGFVARTPILLGAILLDLLGVLFGGAVALLPLFARSILHTGAVGVGFLRAAPAAGALVAAVWMTRRPLGARAGRLLLTVVAVFGVSMIVFGFSRSYPLSMAALAVSGYVDAFSMNIRATIVALATPDALRGRVNAVAMVFISASNQLGAFESGVAAALVGAVPAVVGGGVVTFALAAVWSRLFPPLAGVDRLDEVRPTEPPLSVVSRERATGLGEGELLGREALGAPRVIVHVAGPVGHDPAALVPVPGIAVGPRRAAEAGLQFTV